MKESVHSLFGTTEFIIRLCQDTLKEKGSLKKVFENERFKKIVEEGLLDFSHERKEELKEFLKNCHSLSEVRCWCAYVFDADMAWRLKTVIRYGKATEKLCREYNKDFEARMIEELVKVDLQNKLRKIFEGEDAENMKKIFKVFSDYIIVELLRVIGRFYPSDRENTSSAEDLWIRLVQYFRGNISDKLIEHLFKLEEEL